MVNKDFHSIIELVQAFPDEQTCITHMEELRWNGHMISPFDPSSKVYKCKGNKYRCKNTGKYFNVRTATLFDNTKIELRKWFLTIYIVTAHKKGISSLQLSRDLDITQKTAWFMLQRIRNCFGFDAILDNEVEADETYMGGKNKNKNNDKKVESSQGRSTKAKTPVFGMIEREDQLIAKKFENTTVDTLTREAVKTINETATLYTDEYSGYTGIAKVFDHHVIKHNENQYVNGRIHTNTIEGFWSLLKRGIFGIYHFTSRKHLQMYIDEFVFRYNTRNFVEAERFNLMLQNTEFRLTHKELING